MANLKVRIEINPGGNGAIFYKLGAISKETETFLRYLAQDLGVDAKKENWLANNFYNGSVGFDATCIGDSISASQIAAYNESIVHLNKYDPDRDPINPRLNPRTYRQFAKIGESMDSDEIIKIGLFSNSSQEHPEAWQHIKKQHLAKIEDAEKALIEYKGSIQGVVHSWFLESQRPYFKIRDIVSNALVDCYYSEDIYSVIHDATKDKNNIIHAAGLIKANRLEKVPLTLVLEKIISYEGLNDDEFNKFFGCAPDLTGNLTTSEFIKMQRDDN